MCLQLGSDMVQAPRGWLRVRFSYSRDPAIARKYRARSGCVLDPRLGGPPDTCAMGPDRNETRAAMAIVSATRRASD